MDGFGYVEFEKVTRTIEKLKEHQIVVETFIRLKVVLFLMHLNNFFLGLRLTTGHAASFRAVSMLYYLRNIILIIHVFDS